MLGLLSSVSRKFAQQFHSLTPYVPYVSVASTRLTHMQVPMVPYFR